LLISSKWEGTFAVNKIRAIAVLCLLGAALWASDGVSLSGTIIDPGDAAVPGAKVTATETATAVKQTVTSDGHGFYSFQSLAVGRYDLEIDAAGFKPVRRTGVVLDVNSKTVIDASLVIGERSETLVVSASAAHVETADTQMGQVITGQQMTAVPLNGRSYTDLLALQSGVVPVTSLTSATQQDVGVSALSPSGGLNPGTISINGQREFANSFVLNGSDVEEDVNMGAAIVPNLDAIAEFRILTSNFDAEHGEFSGDKVGNQCVPRERLRVPAQYRSGCSQLLFAHARGV
jgi:Carboxypeptidase regulatory-like domain